MVRCVLWTDTAFSQGRGVKVILIPISGTYPATEFSPGQIRMCWLSFYSGFSDRWAAETYWWILRIIGIFWMSDHTTLRNILGIYFKISIRFWLMVKAFHAVEKSTLIELTLNKIHFITSAFSSSYNNS